MRRGSGGPRASSRQGGGAVPGPFWQDSGGARGDGTVSQLSHGRGRAGEFLRPAGDGASQKGSRGLLEAISERRESAANGTDLAAIRRSSCGGIGEVTGV